LRKGARRIDWSTKDLKYLRDNAGLIPISKISKHLGKSPKAIQRKAETLGLSTRYFNSTLAWCPNCAHMRTEINPHTGVCRVCSKQKQLDKSEQRISEALAQLPFEQRSVLEHFELSRGSEIPPKPVMKKVSTKPRYRYRRNRELIRYERELELWEIKYLDRRINANKKRLERIRMRLGTNPRKKSK